MKIKLVLIFFLLLGAGYKLNTVNAQENIIKLYDGATPGSEDWTQKEFRYGYQSPIWHEKNVALFNVVEPTLTVFSPSRKNATKVAVIVCPGGGFSALSWDTEGINVGQKLAKMGITAFVLKYRISFSGATSEEVNLVARTSYGGEDRTPESLELVKKNNEITQKISENYKQNPENKVNMSAPFTRSLGNIPKMAGDDGRKAVEYVRKNADKLGIDPDKIGLLGFSAGGMVTLDVAFNHNKQSRPDVIGVIYGAFGAKGIPDDPMPMFMAATQYEAIGGTAALYKDWCDARLPAEIHSFTDSNHGFGYRNNDDSVNIWIELFYNFLKKVDFIE